MNDIEPPTPSQHDVVVVGGGAAGLSAALVLSRARRSVAVVDAGQPRNAPAAHMQGFLSRDGMPPAELLEVGRAEVESYGAQVVRGTAESVALREDGFDGFFSLEPHLSAAHSLGGFSGPDLFTEAWQAFTDLLRAEGIEYR